VVNPSATPVPFAFTFGSGRLVDGEAGASSVTTYAIDAGGTLSDPRSATDGQTALCWILRVGDVYYVSNTGSNDLSSFTVDSSGAAHTPKKRHHDFEPGSSSRRAATRHASRMRSR